MGSRNVFYIGFDLFAESKEINQKWKYAFIDSNDIAKTDFIYDDIEIFSEGFCLVQIGKEFHFLDPQLNILYTVKADNVTSFHEGSVRVDIGKKYFWINTKFEKIE